MDILDLLQLVDSDFLKKLQLEQLTSNEKLGDPAALKEVLVYKLSPFKPVDLSSGKLPISLVSSVNIDHSTQLFNEKNDKDTDQILGEVDNEPTILTLNTDFPVLKHAFSFSVSARNCLIPAIMIGR